MAPDATKTHSIGGTDDLLLSVIKDQASDLEHGWREAITNGIDAPNADLVQAWLKEDYSIITDNGDGRDLSDDYGASLLTNLAETSKDRDDDSTIGQFGIGKGQIIAKARTTFISHDTALHFNINEWGINDAVHETTAEDAVSFLKGHNTDWANHVEEGLEKHNGGMTVVVSHYDDETPNAEYKWDEYKSRIRDRYTYIGLAQDITVEINDEEVSKDEIDVDDSQRSVNKRTSLDSGGEVIIGLTHNISGDIDVYSNGVYVKSISRRGFSGAIVTTRNLDLNFARNDIKSGCERWAEIETLIDEYALEICESIPTDRLNSKARRFVTDQMSEDGETFEAWRDEPVFKMTNDTKVSVDEIDQNGEVGYESGSTDITDGILERESTIILDTSDSATSRFKSEFDGEKVSVERFDVERRGDEHNLTATHDRLNKADLTPRQRQRMVVGQELVRRMDKSRKVYWGESDTRHAWTDGYTYIVVTDTAADKSKWIGWVSQLFQTVSHELAHDENTLENDPSHGSYFNRRYRQIRDNNSDVEAEIMEEINEIGIRSFVEKYS